MVGVTALNDLRLAEHGAQLFRGAALADLPELEAAMDALPPDQAGIRLHGVAALHAHLAPTGCIGAIASKAIGAEARPVRAILFDKSAATNWSLGWHQDRTICVRERVDVPGFEPWSIKAGLYHVAPPIELLSRMVTVRVHLDDVPATNAPLLIATGSHEHGRVSESSVAQVVAECGIAVCLAEAGDVWAYSTPILHASDAARSPERRRVLQVDFSADELPGGLEWLGV
ncbi:phytanoyl-CoA dioxygenase family protein [Novosphingobium sp. KACC 22771]|uniref:phytanoyl-CoA dioxygenase family protein n=1 Tax=Novosphingobium sp. KACC 22771 TaxID=3025670 RepID=UPI0023668711|nr:phytanoyl-CoA dioxygenase family protein [Novosphingobium sp. KACC 22771]WDF72269.1 phytanoyl-CoA dioxygenase family protein [Novosphingobium sp. KACC 22771]